MPGGPPGQITHGKSSSGANSTSRPSSPDRPGIPASPGLPSSPGGPGLPGIPLGQLSGLHPWQICRSQGFLLVLAEKKMAFLASSPVLGSWTDTAGLGCNSDQILLVSSRKLLAFCSIKYLWSLARLNKSGTDTSREMVVMALIAVVAKAKW
ncbi:unnamed protein product [Bursaphelenchus okinawaensis]|uniref:Uncharacterized protein n=1 Tax=Bursaphelenchus okinawaensis TaxID=465554 RepID=A0A811LNG8_9BILA|nr:unnamed protein product [Bursaphelenchus okinawaensis]CAG9124467.1 unnamed protein product [Bursaphelenchus okinawaensis]